MRHTPSVALHVVGYALMTFLLTVFVGVGVVMTLGAAGVGFLTTKLPPDVARFAAVPSLLFVCVPGVITLVGVAMWVVVARQIPKLLNAPLKRVVAVVRDERTEMTSHMHSDRQQVDTAYFLLLEERGGERTEYRVDGQLAGAVTQGDIGVAYVRGGALLDFKRVVN